MASAPFATRTPVLPAGSMTVGDPPPVGTTMVPALVAVRRMLPAGSVDHVSAAPVARSARVHAGIAKALMVACEAPASQCAASASEPAKPRSARQASSCKPVSAGRIVRGFDTSPAAATRLPVCPAASTVSRNRIALPSLVAATQGARDAADAVRDPLVEVHTVSWPTPAVFLFDH